MNRQRKEIVVTPNIPALSWPLERRVIRPDQLPKIHIPFYAAPWRIVEITPMYFEVHCTVAPTNIEPKSELVAVVSCITAEDKESLIRHICAINEDALRLDTRQRLQGGLLMPMRTLVTCSTAEITLDMIQLPSVPRLKVTDSNGNCLYTDANPADMQTSHVAELNEALAILGRNDQMEPATKISLETELRQQRSDVLTALRKTREEMLRNRILLHNSLVTTQAPHTRHTVSRHHD